MANELDAKEAELLAQSSSINTATKGSLFGNMRRRKGGWEVRPGFGQVAQFDTLASTPNPSVDSNYGYKKILGSKVFLTSFGHYQIVTVLLARIRISSFRDSGPYQDAYCVSIYDVTTDERHEEVLYIQAKQVSSNPIEMINASVFYEERINLTSKTVLRGIDEPIAFVEIGDSILFSAKNLGLWCYTPCDFGGIPKTPQLDTMGRSQAPPLGDSSRIYPIVAAPGNNPQQSPYFDSAGFPSPTSLTALGTIPVYADGTNVFFADAMTPGSIAATQVLACSSFQSEITAIAQKNGYIYVWGKNETWVFQPGEATAIPGRFQQLSSSVGCISQRAICQREDTLMWVSDRGIHILTDPMDIETISNPMRPLFDDEMSNPLSSYWTENGADTGLDMPQPRVAWNWADRGDVTCAYDNLLQIVYVTIPNQNLLLTIQRLEDGSNSWAINTFETLVVPADRTGVQVNQTITNPQILALDGRVWCVSGLETYVPQDPVEFGNFSTTSYIISELGRGGCLDRTVYKTEDQRVGDGYFTFPPGQSLSTTNQYYIEFGRPTVMPVGYKYPSGYVAETEETLLVPMSALIPPGTTNVTISFFVPVGWEIIEDSFNPGKGSFLLPPERRSGEYAPAVDITVSGSSVTIVYDATLNSSLIKSINASFCVAPLLFLGFRRTDPNSSSGMIFTLLGNATIIAKLVSYEVVAIQYVQAWITNRHTDDDTAQPIDWFAKSDQIGVQGPNHLRTRGVFMRMLTRGTGLPIYDTNSWIGTLNALATSDWKDWAMQIIDTENGGAVKIGKLTVTNAEQEANQPIRSRLSNNGDVVRNLFGYQSSWEDASAPGQGNTLIGDEQFDSIAVSAATKGEHLSWMIFGSSVNRAQHILLHTAKAVIRTVGQRRRWGRS